jgi:two-component system NtrC family sensor kinase
MAKIDVLYIEDRPEQRRSVARRLRSRGFRVRTASSGEACLTQLDSRFPDVLLCDLNMPGLSGLEVLRRVKARRPHMPVVIVTAHGSVRLAREAIKQGAYRFLLKPVKTAELELTIHQALENQRLAERLSESEARGRHLEQLEFANRQLSALNQVSNRFSQIRDEDELLEEVPRLLTASLEFDRGLVLFHDGQELFIRSSSFAKDSPAFVESFFERIRKEKLAPPLPFRESFAENKTLFIPDLNADPRWPRAPGEVIRTKAIVIAPIRCQNRPVGVLVGNMQHHQRAMDAQDVARFEMFANMVGLALDNIRAYQGLERTVVERTESLRQANQELLENTQSLEASRLELARANVTLLAAREELESKNAELGSLLRELSKSSEELQAILDSSLAAIVMVDPEGKIVAANRRVTDFFGVSVEDALHSELERFHARLRDSAADPGRWEEAIRSQRETGVSSEEEALEALKHYDNAVHLTRPTARDLSIVSVPVKDAGERELGRVWVYTDVTRLKQADEQLHLIVQAAPIPSLISRISDGKILYANERMAAMVALSASELIGRHSPEFYYDPGERAAVIERLRRDGHLDDFEVRLRRADGTIIWTVFSMVAIELGGEPVILSGAYDITRRKRAEEALEQERNFVSAVLDTAGALVVVLDPQGRVVRFNRACERITGYAFEEVKGKPFPETFLLAEERAEVEADFGKLLAGLPALARRNHWVTRAGDPRLIEWSNTTLAGPDGRVEYVVATGIDITDRHQAQQKLKLYRQIFNRSYDGIIVLDRDGRFVERNPIHRLLSGYDDEELKGRSAADMFGAQVAETVMRTVREEGSFRGELRAPRKDGIQVPIDVSVFSIVNEAGEILYYVGIGRDITERKKSEEALQRAHDELEQRVKERTAELAQVNAALLAEVAERKHAEEAIRRSHQLLSKQNTVLAELAKRLTPERGDLQALLGELTRAASQTLEVARVSIWMYRADPSCLECLDLFDATAGRHERGQCLSASDYPAYFAALGEHRTIAAHDARNDPHTREFAESYLAPLGITSMLDAPIWLEGKMVGVACHEHVGPARQWTPEEERFAASVADFASLTLEAHQRWEAEQALRKAHDELETRVEQRTAQLARMNVAYRDEINERRQAQEQLAARLQYEEGLAACSKTLLTASDSVSSLGEALSHLLQASRASGVYIFENFEDPKDGLCMRQTYDVCADTFSAEQAPAAPLPMTFADPSLQHVPYRKLQRWREELAAGNPVGGVVDSLPAAEREFLSSRNVRSFVALPLFVEGAWYGFMGFMDTAEERSWSKEDIRSLKTAAEMVGFYIGRKRAAEALRLSEERFRSLVENANDIIFSMEADGTLTYISPKFTEAMGYEVSEFLGKSLIPLMHPDDQERARAWLESGMESGERFSGYEHRFRHRNGDWLWFISTASVLLDEEGKPRQIIGISHDITRMKQVAEDLAHANHELRDAQAQLVQSEKMASLGMLVAGIAHEINTPVGAISSMHDTLIRAVEKLRTALDRQHPGMVDASPEVQSALKLVQEANRVIENGAERVTTIVRRLRSFARLDEAELKKVDVHEGIEDTLTLIHHELKHSITVNREYGAIPPIACYPGRLNQVFLNLLNNARQAISGKGEITIRTYVQDDQVHIAFKDSGSGIPPQHLKKIFDPGFTTKGVGVGTGLGLSICYQIVRDHRGEIRVESEVGSGTTFTVILPMNLDQSLPQAGARLPLEVR